MAKVGSIGSESTLFYQDCQDAIHLQSNQASSSLTITQVPVISDVFFSSGAAILLLLCVCVVSVSVLCCLT